MRQQDKVEREFFESEGGEGNYWIELKPGFILNGDWTHAIVESTKTAARRQLSRVVPCDCAECKELMAKARH